MQIYEFSYIQPNIFFKFYSVFKKEPGEWKRGAGTKKRGDRNKLSPLPPGAESGTRTRDLLITNELLYQLSYFGDNRNRI
jgi:hypothetical protein